MDDTRLVGVNEAASRLGMSRYQVYRRIERGDIQAQLVNNPTARYMIPETELTRPKTELTPPAKPRQLLRVSEVAALTGMTVDTVRRLCQQGLLPSAPRPSTRSHFRIPREAVEEMFKVS